MNTQCDLRMAVFSMAAILFAETAGAEHLRVMRMGLGAGTITATGLNCPGDCDETYAIGTLVTLTANPDVGSVFVRWEGDATGAGNPTTVTMSVDRSVRAVFDLATPIPTLSGLTPADIQTYLTANPIVNTPARFLKALPPEFKQNWLLMTRSESLQTGTAESPRLLLPGADARAVFTIGMLQHLSYPGSHPNAIEYMQWDGSDKNFHFHEIVLDTIPPTGEHFNDNTFAIPARSRGVSADDAKCFKCHSTRNVLNNGPWVGTTGIPPGSVPWKNKPNWDTYDSWAGLMPFNRDRIYQGSVEAAAFRKLLNWWTWSANEPIRQIMEQLVFQPLGVPAAHVITQTSGGANDGHLNFSFDTGLVLTEPAPSGPGSINTAYSFNGVAVAPNTGTPVTRGGSFVTLHHTATPTSDEGRSVHFFDLLGGLAGSLNQQRVADEVIHHRFATGSFPIDVRPIALAIAQGWVVRSGNTVISTVGPALSVNFAFFNSRFGGMNIGQIFNDTKAREQSMPQRKADREKKNLDRSADEYLSAFAGGAADGLIQAFGAATSQGTDTALARLRQEVFRRPLDAGSGDSAGVMGGVYVDREIYDGNAEKMALFRYFLEPLGVSVDKWSMGVRGRSRTYSFADIFGTYITQFVNDLTASLQADPIGTLDPTSGAAVINHLNSTLIASQLPDPNGCPKFTDVQRIFNKGCVECHGGLLYPPYRNALPPTIGPNDHLDLSEDENPASTVGVSPRLARSYSMAQALTSVPAMNSFIYLRITQTSEACPFGLMPCGGPALSKVDIETIRRWIDCPSGSAPFTVGDTHIRTVNGVNYDFQAVGEFVLLRDEYLEIQSRQTAVGTDGPLGPNPYTGLTSCVSINTAIAIRIGNDRVTYQPNTSGQIDPTGLQLRINGKLTPLTAQPIPLASGGRVIQTTPPGGIQVEAPGGSVIVITTNFWDNYQVWYLNVDARNVRAATGVMGTISQGNWLPELPDGTPVGSMPPGLLQRYQILYGVFGNAWRVSDATSLFDYAPGTSTATFTIPYWPGYGVTNCIPPPQPNIINRPPQAPLTLKEAEDAASGIVDPDLRTNCVHDVMVTGERGFAANYLRLDRIARNALPSAPALVVPVDFPTNKLAQPITFTWNRATDTDGDPVNYKILMWVAGQTPNNNNAQPVSGLPRLSVKPTKGFVVIEWAATGAVLQSADSVTGPWGDIPNAISPYLVTPTASMQFYRLRGGDQEQISTTVSNLVSGQLYYWKIIAEDGVGGTVESETRGFVVE